MVTLQNRSRRLQVFNLPHDSYCADECRCNATEMLERHHDAGTGEVGIRQITKDIAGSITFLGGETKKGLPDEILNCPEIKAALLRDEDGLVQVED